MADKVCGIIQEHGGHRWVCGERTNPNTHLSKTFGVPVAPTAFCNKTA
jgi:hypothetical protein